MTIIVGSTQGVTLSAPVGRTPLVSAVDLLILDTALVRSPTALQVVVSGAGPGDTLTFKIDGGATVYTATADAGGFLGQTSIPVPATVGAGTHTLSVQTVEHGTDSEDFTLRNDAALFPEEQNPDVDPVYIDGSDGRWVLQDVMPGGLGSWIMPLSPMSMTPPHLAKTVDVQHTTAREGQYIVARGDLEVVSWTLAGYSPNVAYQEQLEAYAALERRIYIIDHRGRAWKVAIESLKIQKRKRQNDSYTPDGGSVSVTQLMNDEATDWTLVASILGQSWATPV